MQEVHASRAGYCQFICIGNIAINVCISVCVCDFMGLPALLFAKGIFDTCRWAPHTLKTRYQSRKPRGAVCSMPWASPTPPVPAPLRVSKAPAALPSGTCLCHTFLLLHHLFSSHPANIPLALRIMLTSSGWVYTTCCGSSQGGWLVMIFMACICWTM